MEYFVSIFHFLKCIGVIGTISLLLVSIHKLNLGNILIWLRGKNVYIIGE